MRRIVHRLQHAQVRASVAVTIVALITFAIVALLGGSQREQIETDAMIDDLQARVVQVGSIHSAIANSNSVTPPAVLEFERTRQQIDAELQALRPRIDDDALYAVLESRFIAYLAALSALIDAARAGTAPAELATAKAQSATALFNLAGAIRATREHLTAESTSAWNTARVGFAGAIMFLVGAVLGITRFTERRLRRALIEEERSRLAEEQLRFHALHDPLTGLVNRTVFAQHVGKALQRSRRAGSSFAVMFLDLDNFKDVNDTWGHAIGDELLIGVAERLRGVLREGDTAARQGGDEFVLLIEDIASLNDAASVADRIHAALALPFATSSRELSTSASIGVFVSDGTGDGDVDSALRYADIAMYRAKRDGRRNTAFYTARASQPDADRPRRETA